MTDFSQIPEAEKKRQWFLLIEPIAKVRRSRPNHQDSKLLMALEKKKGPANWENVKLVMENALNNSINAERIFSRASQINTDPNPDGVIDDMFAEARTVPYLHLKGFRNINYNRRDGLDFSAEFENQTYYIEVAYIRGPCFKTQETVFTTEQTNIPVFQLKARKLINRLKTIYIEKEKQVIKHGMNSSNAIIFIISDLEEMYEPWLEHELFEGNHPLQGFILSRKIPTIIFAPGTVYEPSASSLNQTFGVLQPFDWEKFKIMTYPNH